jgi:hypothetical protein
MLGDVPLVGHLSDDKVNGIWKLENSKVKSCKIRKIATKFVQLEIPSLLIDFLLFVSILCILFSPPTPELSQGNSLTRLKRLGYTHHNWYHRGKRCRPSLQ